MADDRETAIELIEGNDTLTYFTSQRKYINYIHKLAEKYPDECIIAYENPDGSVCVHMPASWFPKPKPPKRVSEEQKLAMGKRAKQMWADKKSNEEDDFDDET